MFSSTTLRGEGGGKFSKVEKTDMKVEFLSYYRVHKPKFKSIKQYFDLGSLGWGVGGCVHHPVKGERGVKLKKNTGVHFAMSNFIMIH